MVTAGATANTTEGNSRASKESDLLCSHSHGESIGLIGVHTLCREARLTVMLDGYLAPINCYLNEIRV